MSERNETRVRRITAAAMTAVFLAGIALPCAATFLRLDTGGFTWENRAPTPYPHLSLHRAALVKFPRDFEAWFNDHFGFRNTFVRAHSRIKHALGISTSEQVVIGRKGWFFYATNHIIDSCRGMYPFTDQELLQWQRLLEERRDWLASQGIRYVFMVSPEKSSIYPELLPDALRPVKANSRVDQLVEHMRAHSTVDVLDLREGVRAAKSEGRAYHVTDTHWTDIGAFGAYRQMAEYLRGKFPAVKPLERSDFDCRVVATEGGDLAGMLGVKGYLREERPCFFRVSPGAADNAPLSGLMRQRTWPPEHGPVVMERKDAEIGRAVVVRDSFFVQVVPFLSNHFRRTVYLWWSFDPAIIADEKPDIVIEEVIERVLNTPPAENPPPVRGFRPAR